MNVSMRKGGSKMFSFFNRQTCSQKTEIHTESPFTYPNNSGMSPMTLKLSMPTSGDRSEPTPSLLSDILMNEQLFEIFDGKSIFLQAEVQVERERNGKPECLTVSGKVPVTLNRGVRNGKRTREIHVRGHLRRKRSPTDNINCSIERTYSKWGARGDCSIIGNAQQGPVPSQNRASPDDLVSMTKNSWRKSTKPSCCHMGMKEDERRKRLGLWCVEDVKPSGIHSVKKKCEESTKQPKVQNWSTYFDVSSPLSRVAGRNPSKLSDWKDEVLTPRFSESNVKKESRSPSASKEKRKHRRRSSIKSKKKDKQKTSCQNPMSPVESERIVQEIINEAEPFKSFLLPQTGVRRSKKAVSNRTILAGERTSGMFAQVYENTHPPLGSVVDPHFTSTPNMEETHSKICSVVDRKPKNSYGIEGNRNRRPQDDPPSMKIHDITCVADEENDFVFEAEEDSVEQVGQDWKQILAGRDRAGVEKNEETEYEDANSDRQNYRIGNRPDTPKRTKILESEQLRRTASRNSQIRSGSRKKMNAGREESEREEFHEPWYKASPDSVDCSQRGEMRNCQGWSCKNTQGSVARRRPNGKEADPLKLTTAGEVQKESSFDGNEAQEGEDTYQKLMSTRKQYSRSSSVPQAMGNDGKYETDETLLAREEDAMAGVLWKLAMGDREQKSDTMSNITSKLGKSRGKLLEDMGRVVDDFKTGKDRTAGRIALEKVGEALKDFDKVAENWRQKGWASVLETIDMAAERLKNEVKKTVSKEISFEDKDNLREKLKNDKNQRWNEGLSSKTMRRRGTQKKHGRSCETPYNPIVPNRRRSARAVLTRGQTSPKNTRRIRSRPYTEPTYEATAYHRTYPKYDGIEPDRNESPHRVCDCEGCCGRVDLMSRTRPKITDEAVPPNKVQLDPQSLNPVTTITVSRSQTTYHQYDDGTCSVVKSGKQLVVLEAPKGLYYCPPTGQEDDSQLLEK